MGPDAVRLICIYYAVVITSEPRLELGWEQCKGHGNGTRLWKSKWLIGISQPGICPRMGSLQVACKGPKKKAACQSLCEEWNLDGWRS